MKIFILFALVTVSVCNDGSNLYDSDSRPQVGCGPYGSSSAGSSGQLSHSGESISSGGPADGSTHSGGSTWGESSTWDASSSSYNYSKSYSQHYQHYNFQCTSEYKNALKGDKHCMRYALQKVPALTISLIQVLGKYSGEEADYDQLIVELTKVAKCAGCVAGDPWDWKELGHTTGGVGKVGGEAVKTLLHHVLEKIEITRSVFDLACNLLGPVLSETCLKEITTNQLSSVTGDAKAFLCGKKESLDLPQMYDVLENVKCVLDDTVEVEEETFGDLTTQLGDSVLPILSYVFKVIEDVSPLDGTLCTVANTLNGVIDGGDSGDGALSGVTTLISGGGGGGGGSRLLGGGGSPLRR